MKHIQIILGLLLLASLSTFAQSPRIKLNQITKDTVKGSVLISSPSDSGMVYSRDFYVAYGLTDTVLILYGDTLAATSGIISSVLSDGVTITGNGTNGNELKVDTLLIATIKALNDSLATISASTTPDGVTITGDGSVGNPLKVDTLLIATIKALNDSLATISASTTPDGVTITGDGSVGNPLKVDTSTVISTIKGLVDTLTNRGYLTANQTITLSGDVTGSGTTAITATVVDDSHEHIISNVDFLQDSLNAKANDSDLANYVTLSGAETITGAKTFTNTFTQSGGDANFDSGTLYVDESANRVGIGTSSPDAPLQVYKSSGTVDTVAKIGGNAGYAYFNNYGDLVGVYQSVKSSLSAAYTGNTAGFGTQTNSNMVIFTNSVERIRIKSSGEVGIGTSSPAQKLDVNGKVKIQDLTGTGGNAVYENGGVLGVASDARFKTYVGDIQNGIALINQLKPKYFIDNRNSSFQQLGFYAQEVKSVINEASYPIGNTDYLGINDRAILATTVKAIQEQQAQIETIQTELNAKSLIIETQASEIDQLKTLITDLTNRIEILENK